MGLGGEGGAGGAWGASRFSGTVTRYASATIFKPEQILSGTVSGPVEPSLMILRSNWCSSTACFFFFFFYRSEASSGRLSDSPSTSTMPVNSPLCPPRQPASVTGEEAKMFSNRRRRRLLPNRAHSLECVHAPSSVCTLPRLLTLVLQCHSSFSSSESESGEAAEARLQRRSGVSALLKPPARFGVI